MDIGRVGIVEHTERHFPAVTFLHVETDVLWDVIIGSTVPGEVTRAVSAQTDGLGVLPATEEIIGRLVIIGTPAQQLFPVAEPALLLGSGRLHAILRRSVGTPEAVPSVDHHPRLGMLAVAFTVTHNGNNAVVLDGKVELAVLRVHAAAVDADGVAGHIAQILVASACAVGIELQALHGTDIYAFPCAWSRLGNFTL